MKRPKITLKQGSVASVRRRSSKLISIRTKLSGTAVEREIVFKRLKIVALKCISVAMLVKAINKKINVYPV